MSDKLVLTGDIYFDSKINICPSISKILKKSKFVVGNIEGCVDVFDYEDQKCAPKLFLEKKWAFLKKNGITHANFYNNHSFDGGSLNYLELIKLIKKHSLVNLPQVYYFHLGQAKICLITTLEFNEHYENDEWIFCTDQEVRELIIKNKKTSDFVIVQCHAGLEKVAEPLYLFKKLYRSYIDAGADLIVGHHPHIVQKIEIYNGKKIYYSIGDFIFHSKSVPRFSPFGLLIEISVEGEKLIDRVYTVHQLEACVTRCSYQPEISSRSLQTSLVDIRKLIMVSRGKLRLRYPVLSLKILYKKLFYAKEFARYQYMIRRHLETNHTYKYLCQAFSLK